MQDKQKKFIISHIFGRTLAMAVFFFLAGCAAGDTQETGLEELTLSEEDQNSEEESDEGQSEERQEDKASGGKASQDDSGKETEDATVFVYVCGAVETPGVYELQADARVFEAIRAAGGVTAEAAPDMVNQAEVITDGEQIYVPTAGEMQAQGLGVGETGAKGTDNGKVNINTASEEELMTLTGIGEAKAAAILKYREEHGRFESIEELMEIEGIKEGVFGKIKDDITI